MTRFSRKCTWIIVLCVFLLAAFIFVSWGSEGFLQWDTSKWFNYWGKGKPTKVVKVVEQPAQQRAMALMSADDGNSLVHDSDDTAITFALTKLPAPSYEWQSDGLHVWTQGKHVAGGELSVGYEGYCWGGELKTFTYGSSGEGKSEEFVVTYDEFDPSSQFAISADFTAGNRNGIYLRNLPVSNYTYSDETNIPLFVTNGELNATMSGTKITFNNVSNVENVVGRTGSSGFSWAGCCEIKITASNGKTCNYMPFSGLNPNDFVTLSDNIYTVDLTKLTFINDTVDVVTVEIVPLLRATRGSDFYIYKGFGWVEPIYFSISKLAAPTGLQYDAGTLTWNEVAGANRYGVFWTDKLGEEQYEIVEEPVYEFDLSAFDEGEHTVRVRALGNMGETLADSEETVMTLSAYNASTTITQLVALTYNINGDTVTKFVPYGKNVADYCYDVSIPKKEFGGWYYDSGFSRKVEKSDVLNGDITIYARLLDKKVTERKLTWWEQYQWYIWGGLIGLAALGIVAGVVAGIRKRRAL